jgi:hypothetical protein
MSLNVVKCQYDERRNSKGAALRIQEQIRTDEKLRTPRIYKNLHARLPPPPVGCPEDDKRETNSEHTKKIELTCMTTSHLGWLSRCGSAASAGAGGDIGPGGATLRINEKQTDNNLNL